VLTPPGGVAATASKDKEPRGGARDSPLGPPPVGGAVLLPDDAPCGRAPVSTGGVAAQRGESRTTYGET
jgi:hypothetical protein